METKDKKTIKIFSSYMLIALLGGGFISSSFVIFLSTVKKYSYNEITLIVGITPIVLLPTSFLWGWIMDKHKKLILTNKLITVANTIKIFLLVLLNSFGIFFIINLIGSFLTQPSGGINDEYIMHIVKKTGYPYGKIRVFGAIGFGLSGILAPISIYFFGVKGAFVVGGIIILVTLVFLSKLPEVYVSEKEKKEKIDFFTVLNLFKNKKFILELIALTILVSTSNITGSFAMPIILLHLHAPNEFVVMLPFIMVLMEIVFLFNFHKFKIADKSYLIIVICLILAVVRWTIMANETNYYILIALMLFHGCIIGMVLPTQNKLISILVPKKQQSTAFLFQLVIIPTVLSSILNLFTGYMVSKMGISIFGYTYLGLTIFAGILIIPNIIKGKLINKKF
ncbi:MFS transporter [uncultured Clostridium sp.]|uniref:MFS transporter n=1 Tax=uncultured Clostridium sp. TaxID=59620 RepID=UPI002611C22E|nr:MFS transporter [uncultured Clostridium sp.]